MVLGYKKYCVLSNYYTPASKERRFTVLPLSVFLCVRNTFFGTIFSTTTHHSHLKFKYIKMTVASPIIRTPIFNGDQCYISPNKEQ